MKNLLRGKFHRSQSTGSQNFESSQLTERRFSLPDNSSFEILHSANEATANNETINDNDSGILPTHTTDNESIALSDTDTLQYDKQHRLELQPTYNENYTQFLPYLIRRLRVESDRINENQFSDTSHNSQNNNADTIQSVLDYGDDQETIFSEAINDNRFNETSLPHMRNLVLNKSTSRFNYKRTFIIVDEFMKHNTFIFPNQESFQKFKQIRSKNNSDKKARRGSIIVYDKKGNIKRLSVDMNKSIDLQKTQIIDDNIIDKRSHIIPLEYKLKGDGLPLFKVHTPYMSSFRKNTPFMIFKKYREIPLKPILQAQEDQNNKSGGGGATVEEEEENYETYNFCTVHIKNFSFVKRYILTFKPTGKPSFKLLIFQHNFRSFADFQYSGTRFRILGTSLAGGYLMNYNPYLRLLVIDNDQPSLTDNIINKKSGFELLSIMKKKTDASATTSSKGIATPPQTPNGNSSMNSDNQNDPSNYENPYPNPSCPLLNDKYYGFYTAYSIRRDYIPCDMPPFGQFADSQVYIKNFSILPKKFSEIGKVELYQDISHDQSQNIGVGNGNGSGHGDNDLASTLSIDLDTLVLNCVILVMRENSLKTSTRNSHNGFVNRLGGFNPMNPIIL